MGKTHFLVLGFVIAFVQGVFANPLTLVNRSVGDSGQQWSLNALSSTYLLKLDAQGALSISDKDPDGKEVQVKVDTFGQQFRKISDLCPVQSTQGVAIAIFFGHNGDNSGLWTIVRRNGIYSLGQYLPAVPGQAITGSEFLLLSGAAPTQGLGVLVQERSITGFEIQDSGAIVCLPARELSFVPEYLALGGTSLSSLCYLAIALDSDGVLRLDAASFKAGDWQALQNVSGFVPGVPMVFHLAWLSAGEASVLVVQGERIWQGGWQRGMATGAFGQDLSFQPSRVWGAGAGRAILLLAGEKLYWAAAIDSAWQEIMAQDTTPWAMGIDPVYWQGSYHIPFSSTEAWRVQSGMLERETWASIPAPSVEVR